MRAYNFEVTGCSPTKLWHLTRLYVNASTTFGGTASLNILEGKNVQELVRFTTTFEFERKCLWNR